MTTGATGQLGLALPVQGELSGTWGDTVNNGITQYTNISIAGTLTLTGDGAVTLANTTGDASASNITSTLAGAGTVTAQFAVVRVSGTTTTKVVTGPSYSKTYLVDNASSFAVTFKASGQTGVSVAAAEKVSVYFNGTDYVKIAGTIANAAGSNTQIQFNNGGLFGASANLTWDGTTLSSTQVNITGQGTLRLQDTTGGEYVGLRSPGTLSASYTLTFPADDGTSGQALITDGSGVLSWSTAASGDVYGPASATDNAVARFDGTTGKLIQNGVVIIGDTGAVTGVTDLTASGAVTLSGGTANGVAYLNGSKVVTSGSALQFDGTNLALGVSALAARVMTVRGRAAFVAPSTDSQLAIYSDGTTNGIYSTYNASGSYLPMTFYTADVERYRLGTDGTAIWTIGSEQMRLTSTGLGIGTSSPAYKLQVIGASNFQVNAAGTQQVLQLNNSDTTAGTQAVKLGFSSAGVTKASINAAVYGNDFMTFNVGSDTERMRIDASGNVGIGTSSPASKLDVTATGDATLSITSAGVQRYQLIAKSGGNFEIYDQSSSATRVTLTQAGNLGLGVTPSAWGADWKPLEIGTIGNSFSGLVGDSGTSQNTNCYYASGWKYARTAVASRYEQYLGTHYWFTAPSGTAGNAITFTQAMSLLADGTLVIGKTTADVSVKGFQYRADINSLGISTADSGISNAYFTRTANTGNFFSFLYSTGLTSVGSISTDGSTTAYNTSSDYRLKNITGSITTSGAYIDSLNPVEGTWKADGSTFVGLIAHEVQEASRTTVATGVKDGEEMQGMDYSSPEIIANLIAEVKSLRQRVATLEAK